MKRVRRPLIAATFDCVAVLAALLLLCVSLAFFVLTATAAQQDQPTNSRTVSARSTAVSQWQDVPTNWQENGQFGGDFARKR